MTPKEEAIRAAVQSMARDYAERMDKAKAAKKPALHAAAAEAYLALTGVLEVIDRIEKEAQQ